jgi:CheY-like chemotaxis protein
MKILVIDDSRFQRMASQRALARAGYDTMGAANGELGLKIAREQTPDVILLDMLLPAMSGPDVLRALKQNPITSNIPVIVFSALSAKNEEKLVREGAVAFIEKCDNLLADDAAALVRVVETMIAGRCRQVRKSFSLSASER